MNYKSNLAYDRSTDVAYPIHTHETAGNVRVKVRKNTETVKVARNRVISFFKASLIILFAFTVLYRGLMITDRSASIEEKRKSLEVLTTTNEKLQYEIDRSLDLDKVEAVVQNELGMRRADKHQTVYVNLEQTDYVEKVAGHNVNEKNGIAGFFSRIVAYFS